MEENTRSDYEDNFSVSIPFQNGHNRPLGQQNDVDTQLDLCPPCRRMRWTLMSQIFQHYL
jgi:hypothetical protein